MCRCSKSKNRIQGIIGVLLAAVLLVAGCSAAVPDPSQAPTVPSAVAVETELSKLPVRYPGVPLWTKEFGGTVNAGIDSTGNVVSIVRSLYPGELGLSLYTREGLPLWSSRFTQVQGGKVILLPGAHRVVSVLTNEDQASTVTLFDEVGNILWSGTSGTGTTVQGSPQGNALAIIDHTNGIVRILSEDGKPLFQASVQGRATAQFVDSGKLVLIEDEVQLTLVQLDGTVLWKYPLNRDLSRHVVMTTDGKYIAVATGQSDSMIYLFNSSGKALWKHPLEFGGANLLKFSQDDQYVAVYDVGTNAGVYLFDVAGGRLSWRVRFKTLENHQVTAASLTFGDEVVVELLDSTQDTDGQEVTLHRLVGLGFDGTALWRSDQGRNVRLSMNSDATSLLVTERLPLSNLQNTPKWRISMFDTLDLLNIPHEQSH